MTEILDPEVITEQQKPSSTKFTKSFRMSEADNDKLRRIINKVAVVAGSTKINESIILRALLQLGNTVSGEQIIEIVRKLD